MRKESLFIKYKDISTEIPYYVFEGGRPGPTFVLSGGMHGDEINGIVLVSAFLDWAIESSLESRLFGKLIVVPVLNPSGFAHMQRRVFEDNMDLNRCFGVDSITTYSEYYAAELTKHFFSQCDYGIDIHDSGGRAVLVPHSRIHQCTDEVCDLHTRRMGVLFDSQIVMVRHGHPHMLAVAMERDFQIPIITLEVGGEQTIFDQWHVDSLQGVKNNMIEYGLFEGDIVIKQQKQIFLEKRSGFESSCAGWLQLDVDFGNEVHRGDHIGRFFDPMTQSWSSLESPFCGVVFSKWHADQIPEGETMYSVLEHKGCCGD